MPSATEFLQASAKDFLSDALPDLGPQTQVQIAGKDYASGNTGLTESLARPFFPQGQQTSAREFLGTAAMGPVPLIQAALPTTTPEERKQAGPLLGGASKIAESVGKVASMAPLLATPEIGGAVSKILATLFGTQAASNAGKELGAAVGTPSNQREPGTLPAAIIDEAANAIPIAGMMHAALPAQPRIADVLSQPKPERIQNVPTEKAPIEVQATVTPVEAKPVIQPDQGGQTAASRPPVPAAQGGGIPPEKADVGQLLKAGAKGTSDQRKAFRQIKAQAKEEGMTPREFVSAVTAGAIEHPEGKAAIDVLQKGSAPVPPSALPQPPVAEAKAANVPQKHLPSKVVPVNSGNDAGMESGVHATVAQNAPPDAGATAAGKLPTVRPDVPPEGQNPAVAVPLRGAGGDAPRRLQQAAGSDVVVPETSSGAAPQFNSLDDIDASKLSPAQKVKARDKFLKSKGVKPPAEPEKPQISAGPGAADRREPDLFGRPTIDQIIDPSLRDKVSAPVVGGGSPHETPSFVSRIHDAVTGIGTGPTAEAVKGWLGTVAGKTMPKITIADRATGEAGGRYAASRAAAIPMADLFSNDVLTGLNVEQSKFHAALLADNLLSVKEGFEATTKDPKASPEEQAAALENAQKVNTLFGSKNFPFKTEAELQAYLKDPEVAEAVKRHIDNWQQVVEPKYRQAADIDPDIELPSRGKYSGARINLNPVVEGYYEPSKGTRVGGASSGNLLATMRRKTPFARQAFGTGQEYVLNYPESIANTFSKTLEIANKRAFEDKLVESGNAVIGPSGKQTMLKDGSATEAFPLSRRTVVIPGEPTKVFGQGQSIYIRKSLATEYANAANAGRQDYSGLVTGFNKTLTRAALAGLTDATVHVENLGTALFQVPGTSGTPLLADALLSAAGRLDIPLAMARLAIKAAPEIISRSDFLQKVLPAKLTDAVNRSLLKNMTQMAGIAEINASRTPHDAKIGSGFLSRGVQASDRVTRMVLSDTYDNLVREGIVKNNETQRREFINQAGNYNLRTQGNWMRMLRQTWISPFATAGRNFATLGVRGATMNPGVEGTSLKAAAALRANMAAKWVGTAALVGTVNWLISGQLTGYPGTRLGSISYKDKDGKVHQWDVAAFTGQSRAMRTIGARGFIEAKRLGLTTTDAVGSGARDIANTALGAVAGPGPRAVVTALTGYPAAINVGRESRVVPPGSSQLAENVKTAAVQSNPITGSISDAMQPGATLAAVARRQLPRFSLQPGKPLDMVEKYPQIVQKAEANAFIEDVIHQARQVPMAQRNRFVNEQIQRLPPDLQMKAWREVNSRYVFRE